MSQSAKEMLRWIPPYYSESSIYKEQNTAKGKEIDILKYIINDLKNQFSPKYATWGLVFWEQLCGIAPAPSDTLDERRKKVMTMLSTMAPLTPTEFVNQIKKATGETTKVYYTDWSVDETKNIQNVHLRRLDPNNKGDYILDIVIVLPTETFDLIDFKDKVYDIVPCHLAIKCSAIVDNSVLRRFTHEQLKAFTHTQIKNCIPLEEVS